MITGILKTLLSFSIKISFLNYYFVNDKGVFLYDDISKAVDIILNIWKMSPKEKNELNESNKKVFENQYDIAVFANNYVKLLQNLD